MKYALLLSAVLFSIGCQRPDPVLQTGSQSVVEDLESVQIVLDLYTADEFLKIMGMMNHDASVPQGANYMLMATILEKPENDTTQPAQLRDLNLKFSVEDPDKTMMQPAVIQVANEAMAHYVSALELSKEGVYAVETSFASGGAIQSASSKFGIKITSADK